MTVYLPITTLLAAGLALLLLTLSWAVIKARQSTGVSLGDKGEVTLQRRIRGQGNLIEYAPLFVVLVGLAEIQGGNAIIIALIALAFFIGRIGHGYALAFTEKNVIGRLGGMMLTLTAMGCIALYDIALVLLLSG